MNLEDFVANTLLEIVAGVSKALVKSPQNISPSIGWGEDDPKILRTSNDNLGVFLVEFDVAVTASEKDSKSGGGGITVFSVASAKGDLSKASEQTSISKVKFSVPITYPRR